MTIARRHGPLELEGVRAPTLDAFRREFAPALAEQRLVVADLSLGAWQSHQAATETAAQLGVELASAEPAEPDPLAERSFAGVIGAFIDLEGEGDTSTLAALAHAERVADAAGDGTVFGVFAPRFGLGWEREDALFVRFLAQARADRSGRLVVVAGDGSPSLPAGWRLRWEADSGATAVPARPRLVGLVPGTVSREAAAALALVETPEPEDSLPLAAGRVLVAPETRRDPRDVSRFEYDKLALATRPGGWLHAYAQVHGNNFYVDPWFLWAQAYREVERRGYGVALRLADRAAECAREPLQQGVVQSLAQGVRIAAQRFEEAAPAPEPPPGLPAGVRAFLLEAKGWALTLTDEPEQADSYFAEAGTLHETIGEAGLEHLYLLNIWALNRLKLGDAAGALALEREIEEGHGRFPERDRRLEYVNSINIARLARRRHDHDEAAEYYGRAFATTLGARSEGDRIYTNVCLARLDEDRGRADEARAAWTRAALHWAAAAAPEALASRVASAIVERKVAPGEVDPDEISTALEARLLAAGATAAAEPPAFVQADRLPAGACEAAILGDGWSVVAASAELRVALESDAFTRLRRALAGIVAAAGVALPRTIAVDDVFGTEMPVTVAQLVALALRLEVPTLVAHGRTLELDAETRSRLERELRVRLGPAVDAVRESVLFRRYLAPRPLSDEERRVIDTASAPTTVGRLKVLRELERSRVVELELPEEAVRAAGLLPADALVAR